MAVTHLSGRDAPYCICEEESIFEVYMDDLKSGTGRGISYISAFVRGLCYLSFLVVWRWGSEGGGLFLGVF